MVHELEVKCENGHSQTIRYVGLEKTFVEELGALIDGSSRFYRYPPGPDSPIGKCGLCKGGVASRIVASYPEDDIEIYGQN